MCNQGAPIKIEKTIISSIHWFRIFHYGKRKLLLLFVPPLATYRFRIARSRSFCNGEITYDRICGILLLKKVIFLTNMIRT